MVVEEVYTNAFSATAVAWTEVGNSPYLHDTDADYIWINLNAKLESYWTFPNSGGSDTINSVILRFEGYGTGDGAGGVTVEVYDGVVWNALGSLGLPVAYGWVEKDVSAILNTWAKINACQVRVKSAISIMPFTLYVRRLTRKVDYTAGAILKSWAASLNATHAFNRPIRFIQLTQNLNTIHVLARPFRFMKLTRTLNTTHTFLRHRFMKLSQILNLTHTFQRPYRKIGYSQTLRTTHTFSRPIRIIKFPTSLQLTHLFTRPLRFMKLLQTLGFIHEWYVTKPGVKGMKMVWVMEPIVINLKTGNVEIMEVLVIGPIAINLKTGEIMVAI